MGSQEFAKFSSTHVYIANHEKKMAAEKPETRDCPMAWEYAWKIQTAVRLVQSLLLEERSELLWYQNKPETKNENSSVMT